MLREEEASEYIEKAEAIGSFQFYFQFYANMAKAICYLNLENFKKSTIYDWLGSKIKNITTLEERSASGLNNTVGVLITHINTDGIIENSALKVGDVILKSQSDTINTVSDLMKSYQNNNWKGKLDLVIFRNQKEKNVTLILKK